MIQIYPIASMYGFIYTNMWLIYVGKYTSPMDAMGIVTLEGFPLLPDKGVEQSRDRKTLIVGMVTIVCQALSERRGLEGVS